MKRRQIDEKYGHLGIALAGAAVLCLAINLVRPYVPAPHGTITLIVIVAALSFVGGLLGALAFPYKPGTRFYLGWRLTRILTAALIVFTVMTQIIQPASP